MDRMQSRIDRIGIASHDILEDALEWGFIDEAWFNAEDQKEMTRYVGVRTQHVAGRNSTYNRCASVQAT